MGKFDLFAKIANYMSKHASGLEQYAKEILPTRKQLKKLRPPRYKAAFSIGFRGYPKSYNRPGAMAAPSLDQVRFIERTYGQKIHVKNGLMFFASDGIMYTSHEAALRQSMQEAG